MGTAGTLAAISVLVDCGSGAAPDAAPNTSTSIPAAASSSTTEATSAVAGLVSIDGIGFFVPDGWTSQSTASIGTALQAGNQDCVSAEVIDDNSPADAGVAASARAAVQICVVERHDALSLEQWLTKRNQRDWLPADYGTCEVLTLMSGPEQQLAYAQLGEVRAEISAVVATTAERTEQRRAQITDLFENMRCTTN